MSVFALFLQIGDLFDGRFNWRGAFHLLLFLMMGAVIFGFAAFGAYQAFKPKKK